MTCHTSNEIARHCNQKSHVCRHCFLQELKYQTGTHPKHTDKEWLECEECGQCYDLKGQKLEY
jgi:hypothetical protein